MATPAGFHLAAMQQSPTLGWIFLFLQVLVTDVTDVMDVKGPLMSVGCEWRFMMIHAM